MRTWRAVTASVASLLLTISSLSPAQATITTDPTSDQAGSNTTVNIGGNPLREGAVLPAGATATVATSALLNPGLGDRIIQTSYDQETVYQAGSVQAPEGWTLEYSTNNGASWVSAEPSPASSVTDIRARKTSVAAGAIDGYSQEYSTETVSSIPSSTFSASTGGDGWGVAFYDDFVFGIYHHAHTIRLDCMVRSTGSRCGGMLGATTITDSGRDFYAGDRTGIEVDTQNGLLYVFTAPTSGTDAGKAGFLCVDVKSFPPTSCGFFASSISGVDAYQDINSIAKSGTRVFGFARVASPAVVCFDYATQTNCGAYTLNGGNTSNVARLKEINSKIFAKSDGQLACLEPISMQACSGWPVATTAVSDYYHSDYDLVEHNDSSGNVDGVCTGTQCFDFAGVSQSWVNPYSVLNNRTYPMYSTSVTTLGRWYNAFYSNNGQSDIECFDFATGAACSGFNFAPRGLMYELTVDPQNPACLWFNSDAGQIKNVDAYTGNYGCGANPVITLQPSQFAPRYACSTANGITSWATLKVSNLVDSSGNSGPSASSISLTVRDALGNAVSGWSGRAVTVNQTLDMTLLDAGVSGSRPTFSFAFNGVTGSLARATISIEYKGKGPELCSTVLMTTPAQAASITVNGYLHDSVAPAGTYQSQRNFSIDPSAQVTSLYQTVPGAPTGLTGSGLNTSATVTFTPPTDNGGLDLTGYQYSLDNGSNWLPMTGDVDNGNGTRSFSLTGLTAGTNYQIKVAATNSLGRGSASSALSLTAQLVDLSSLNDSYMSASPISLVTQNQSSLPYTYTADPASVCTVSGTTLTLVAPGTCTVTQDQAGDANNLATSATKSFEVLADPVAVTVPGAPLNLSATPASGQVSLNWNAPSTNGGADVTDYIVQYKVGTSWVPFNDGVNTLTSVVITGLTNGTNYDFKVAAVNSAGQGLFASSVTSKPATVPGPATALSGSLSSTTASLTWSAPSSNGGSAITDYLVSYKLSSEPTWTLFTDAVSASTGASITGLTAGATYDYQVIAVNAAGNSAPVSTVTLVATNGNEQVSLSWSAPQGVTPTNYVTQYRVAGEANWTEVDNQSTATTATLGSLVNGTEYDVRVAVMVSSSVSSYTSTVRVEPFSTPDAPALTAAAGVQQVVVSWNAPNDNGALITDYLIEYKRTADSSWTTVSDGTSTLTYAVITNLTNGSSYDVRAKSVNSAGQSIYSSIASATPRTVPGAISGLTLTSGPGSLILSWTAPANNGGAAVTDYQIQYRKISSLVWITYSRAASVATELTLPNLDGLTNYAVRVAAVNPAGVGSYGTAGNEVTLQAPVAPVQNNNQISNDSPTPATNAVSLDLGTSKPGANTVDNAVIVDANRRLSITGSNLDLVERVMIGSQEAQFDHSANTLDITVPASLSLMAYQVTLIDTSGQVIPGPLVDVREVITTVGGQEAKLKRLQTGEIKVWVFDPLATGKIQYYLRDREIAWTRPGAEDSAEKLRVQADTGEPYLVRTLRVPKDELSEFELHLDGLVVGYFQLEGRQVQVG